MPSALRDIIPIPNGAAAPTSNGWVHLASPGPGTPMTAKVERWAAPLRRAVTELANGLAIDETTFRCLFAPRLSGLGFYCDQSELANRAAWALAAQWLAGYASGALPAEASLRDAEDWFLGGLSLPSIAPPKTHVGQAIGLIDRQ